MIKKQNDMKLYRSGLTSQGRFTIVGENPKHMMQLSKSGHPSWILIILHSS